MVDKLGNVGRISSYVCKSGICTESPLSMFEAWSLQVAKHRVL